MEGVGLPDEDENTTGAIIENVKYSLLMKEIEQCKSTQKLNENRNMNIEVT